jgi:hypothetical protein
VLETTVPVVVNIGVSSGLAITPHVTPGQQYHFENSINFGTPIRRDPVTSIPHPREQLSGPRARTIGILILILGHVGATHA